MNAESLGHLLGKLIVLSLFVWGVYKAASVAKRPYANSKCAYSLAIVLAAWIIMSLVGGAGGPMSAEDIALIIAAGVLVVILAFTALAFAVLGLREIRQRRVPGELDLTQGRGMAIWAMVLSLPVALSGSSPLVIYATRSYLSTARTAEARAAEAKVTWTPFRSSAGDFTALFPGSPAESLTGAVRTYTIRSRTGEYVVSSSDVPPGRRTTASEVCDNFERSPKIWNKVADRSQVWSGEVPGCEVRLTDEVPAHYGAKVRVRVRIFVTAQHVYQLTVVLPPDASPGDDADRFFTSFTLQPQAP